MDDYSRKSATMASYSSSVQFGQTAFFGQLTPPPTPGSKDSDIIKHTANTGKLRRPKTPEPLLLLGVDYNILTKYLASTDSKAEDDAHPHDTTITSESAIASFAGISPLSANFIINNDVMYVLDSGNTNKGFTNRSVVRCPDRSRTSP